MSRIGKLPVALPSGVKVEVTKSRFKVTGPKGSLEEHYDPKLKITVTDGEVTVVRPDDTPDSRAKHGLVRALIQNMVTGVTEGWVKELEIQGVGYRASMEGKKLNLQVGFSHPLVLDPPAGIEYAVDGTTNIKVH